MTGYMTLSEAASRLEVCRQTVAKMVRRGELTPYQRPTDRRAVLVEAAAVEALRAVRPVAGRREEVRAA